MAGICVGVWRGMARADVGVDEGRDRRKQEEGRIALFSALQLLFSWIITLHLP